MRIWQTSGCKFGGRAREEAGETNGLLVLKFTSCRYMVEALEGKNRAGGGQLDPERRAAQYYMLVHGI